MRRRHDEYLALFSMYPSQASLRASQRLRWRRRTSSVRASTNVRPSSPGAGDFSANATSSAPRAATTSAGAKGYIAVSAAVVPGSRGLISRCAIHRVSNSSAQLAIQRCTCLHKRTGPKISTAEYIPNAAVTPFLVTSSRITRGVPFRICAAGPS